MPAVEQESQPRALDLKHISKTRLRPESDAVMTKYAMGKHNSLDGNELLVERCHAGLIITNSIEATCHDLITNGATRIISGDLR